MDPRFFLGSFCKWRRSVRLERRHFQQEARKERVYILPTYDARFCSLNIGQRRTYCGKDETETNKLTFSSASFESHASLRNQSSPSVRVIKPIDFEMSLVLVVSSCQYIVIPKMPSPINQTVRRCHGAERSFRAVELKLC